MNIPFQSECKQVLKSDHLGAAPNEALNGSTSSPSEKLSGTACKFKSTFFQHFSVKIAFSRKSAKTQFPEKNKAQKILLSLNLQTFRKNRHFLNRTTHK